MNRIKLCAAILAFVCGASLTHAEPTQHKTDATNKVHAAKNSLDGATWHGEQILDGGTGASYTDVVCSGNTLVATRVITGSQRHPERVGAKDISWRLQFEGRLEGRTFIIADKYEKITVRISDDGQTISYMNYSQIYSEVYVRK